MKLFQRMLVASATLGMIAPIGAQAADINIEDMSSYSSTTEVSSNSDFQTIQPGEWTYKSIQEVAEARGCNVSLPESGLSRYDAATIINLCLGEAAEVTPQERILIEEFNTELAVITARVDGLEVRMNDFEAGSFSTTTTLDGKAVFVIGAVDGIEEISTGTGAVATGYVYQMNLNTSFTGDDNLYVRLKTGDWTSDLMQTGSTYHIEGKDNDDFIKVDKIWYTFPIGDDITAFVGPRIENYYMNAAAVSIYRPGALKAFKFSGNGAVFGASTDVGAGFKYEADNGLALGLNFVCKGGDKEAGCLTKEDGNKIDAMLAYTGDNWHLSATYAQMSGGWTAYNYYATALLTPAKGQSVTSGGTGTSDATAWALRGWWRPADSGSATPTISVGYDTIDFGDTHEDNVAEGSGYFVGLMWYDMFQPDDRIGIAFGQPVKATAATAGNTISEVDPFLWEAYYSFKVNDSMEITPAIFGGTDVKSDVNDDIFGAVLTTTFKF